MRGAGAAGRPGRRARAGGSAARRAGGSGTATRSALLVSGSIGMGHDVLAAACAGVLDSQGWSTHTLDAMRMLGQRFGAAGEATFRALLSVPGLFDAIHFGAFRTGNRVAQGVSALA